MTEPATEQPPEDAQIGATRRWLEQAVIGLNLCPFARAPYIKNRVRLRVSAAIDEDQLVADLAEELGLLAASDPDEIETTLLIHPQVLQDFNDYNAFLDVADATLAVLKLDGILQIASFHPQYQFADVAPDDVTNATNRSPYPTLHLIRESSIDRAVAAFPEAEMIFETNLATMERLGAEGWAALQAQCRADAAKR